MTDRRPEFMSYRREENSFDERDRPNPWPNACPQANNAWEARRMLEGTAMLCGVDIETAKDWVWDMEKRAKAAAEQPSQGRQVTTLEQDAQEDPELRMTLEDLGFYFYRAS